MLRPALHLALGVVVTLLAHPAVRTAGRTRGPGKDCG